MLWGNMEELWSSRTIMAVSDVSEVIDLSSEGKDFKAGGGGEGRTPKGNCRVRGAWVSGLWRDRLGRRRTLLLFCEGEEGRWLDVR